MTGPKTGGGDVRIFQGTYSDYLWQREQKGGPGGDVHDDPPPFEEAAPVFHGVYRDDRGECELGNHAARLPDASADQRSAIRASAASRSSRCPGPCVQLLAPDGCGSGTNALSGLPSRRNSRPIT